MTAARAPKPHADALEPADRAPFDSEVLAAIAGGLGSVVGDHESVAPGEIERTRLLETSLYDAWLMVWGPGAVAEHHDHGGSVGAVHVVVGQLAETMVDDLTGEPPAAVAILRGETTTTGATGRHTLTNSTDATTVSVHVFSPPLEPTPDS